MSRRSGPPRVLRKLLAACMPPGPVRDGLVGDLEELYAERRARSGRLAADLWYARQLLGAAVRYLGPDRRAGRDAAGSDAAGGGGRLPGHGVPDSWSTGVRELRTAVRGLRRSPGFTAAAVLTLAVGIGSVTAAFTVLERVVLRPLPVEDQDELVMAWNHHHVREMPHYPVLGDVYRILEDEAAAFASMAGVEWGNPTEVLLESPDGASDVVRRSKVRGDFFGVLGVRPALGRTLSVDDDVAGAEPVAVLSHGLWEDRFGGDRDVVGRTLLLGRIGVRVVGVLPEGFTFPGETDAWIPLRSLHPEWQGDGPPPEEVDLVARLAPGVTPDAAAAELDRIYGEHAELAAPYEGVEPVVRPLESVVLGDLRPTLVLLFGAAGLVLLVACVNVGGLVLVRAGARSPYAAVRRALGAHRWQAARQAWIEGLLLGAAGGLGGVLLGRLTVRVVLTRAPPGLPRMGEVPPPDAATWLFAAAVTAVVTAALAALPVARAGRVDPARTLRGGPTPGAGRPGRAGRRPDRGTLVIVGQTALAVWAAATAVLLVRSLAHLQALDPGLRAEGVMLVELDHPYPLFQVPPDLPDRMERVAQRLDARPGIEAVTPAFARPMAAAGGVAILGRPEGQGQEEAARSNPFLNVEVVGPGYFRLLEIELEEGRGFQPGDRAGAPPVAVVNRRAAEALWPEEDPVGRRLMGFRQTWLTVVGISQDTRYQSLEELLPTLYLPLAQTGIFPPRNLLVRTSGGASVLPALREVLEEIDPAIRPKAASSLRARLEEPLARPRFSVLVLGVLGGAVLLLATVGVYGVLAARIRRRTREMGVRMALGAAPGRLRGMIVRHGVLRAAGGAALGAGAFLASASLVEHLLFGVAPTDPWSLAAAAALVLGAAALASWLPARRAAALDPARTLRAE